MLLNEMNLKALNISAESVLPIEKVVNVEGREVTFKITAFQSGFGSGKKSVVSGIVSLNDTNHTSADLINSDIEAVRRKISKLLGIKSTSGRTTERKPRTPKELTEVEKLKQSLAVARRLPKQWIKIDTVVLRTFFKEAREADRENAKKTLKARAVAPLLEKVAKLSPEERTLLLASLQ